MVKATFDSEDGEYYKAEAFQKLKRILAVDRIERDRHAINPTAEELQTLIKNSAFLEFARFWVMDEKNYLFMYSSPPD